MKYSADLLQQAQAEGYEVVDQDENNTWVILAKPGQTTGIYLDSTGRHHANADEVGRS